MKFEWTCQNTTAAIEFIDLARTGLQNVSESKLRHFWRIEKMSTRDASQTALATAYLRAAHQIFDGTPLLLDDPVALKLLGSVAEQRIRRGVDRYRTPEAMTLRSHVVLRSRYAEDRLSVAVKRGVSQYVIIGAGFDTFALRQPQWANSLKVIEVDHPSSQAAKRSRIAEAGMKIPTNLVFADIDFEHESLLEGLLRHGVTSTDEPIFFIFKRTSL